MPVHATFLGMFWALCSKILQHDTSLQHEKEVGREPQLGLHVLQNMLASCFDAQHASNFACFSNYTVLANIPGHCCSMDDSKEYDDFQDHPHWSHTQVAPLRLITQ